MLRPSAHRVAALAILLTASAAAAQDLEPRAYSNTPTGLNFAIAGYSYSEGEVSTDASIPLEDGDLDLHVALLAYARSFGLLGRSARVDAIVPYGWLDGSATFAGEPVTRKVDGLLDPRMRLSVNWFGAPALTLQEFQSYEQGVIIGTSLLVSAPLGQYEADKAVNLGTNRWSVKPELGISKRWFGRLTTELAGGVTFYTDNDDYLDHSRREQDPLYSLQAHIVYLFPRGFWGALDGTWYAGGRTEIDGVRSDDRQESTRVGATLAIPLTRHHSLKLYGSTGVSVRTGGDFDLLGIAWQVRWGGGL